MRSGKKVTAKLNSRQVVAATAVAAVAAVALDLAATVTTTTATTLGGWMAEKHAFEKHQHQIGFLRPCICTRRALRCGRNFVEGLWQPKENRDLVVGVKRRAKTLDADGASFGAVNSIKDRPAQLPGLPTFAAGHPDHSLEVEFPSLLLGLGVAPPLPFVILCHLCLMCLTAPLHGFFYLIPGSLSGTCQCIIVAGRSGGIRCLGLVLASVATAVAVAAPMRTCDRQMVSF
jgi:hypothetical protein